MGKLRKGVGGACVLAFLAGSMPSYAVPPADAAAGPSAPPAVPAADAIQVSEVPADPPVGQPVRAAGAMVYDEDVRDMPSAPAALASVAPLPAAPSSGGAATLRDIPEVSVKPVDPRIAAPYDALIDEVAREFGVQASLVRAVVSVESRFDPVARSPKGATGLMQLMPATARRFGAIDPTNPRANLRAGTRYLKWLLARFDCNLPLALAAYNAGEGAVDKYGNRIPPYPETRGYVAKVLAHYKVLGGQASVGTALAALPVVIGAPAASDDITVEFTPDAPRVQKVAARANGIKASSALQQMSGLMQAMLFAPRTQ